MDVVLVVLLCLYCGILTLRVNLLVSGCTDLVAACKKQANTVDALHARIVSLETRSGLGPPPERK